jgi:hypothetical protein
LSIFGIGGLFFLWVAAISELVGLPVAWAKVRHTRAWRERPRGLRGVDLLESYIRPILWEAGWVAVVVLAVGALLTWALGLNDTPVVVAGSILVFVIPAVLVGVAVSRLDRREFETVVSEAARAKPAAGSAASSRGSSGPSA